jgi:hypothetical protein
MGDNPYTTGDIQGKWILKKQILQQYSNGVKYTDTTVTTFNGDYIQFNTDGTGLFGENNDQIDFKWNILDRVVTVTKRVSNDLTLVTPYKILTLNKSEFVVIYDQSVRDPKNGTVYKDVSEEHYTR